MSDIKKTVENDETSPKYLLRLVIVLTVICVVIACMLAAVNAVTKDKITENNQKKKSEAICTIFPNSESEFYKSTESGEDIYLVRVDGQAVGYAVTVASSGFGGDIEMMVGIGNDGNTAGVKIVSMSETPGVGEKTSSDSFLGQFIGKPSSDGFDVISGASISSKAVAAGVDAAHAAVEGLEKTATEVTETSDVIPETTPATEIATESIPSTDTMSASATAEPLPTEQVVTDAVSLEQYPDEVGGDPAEVYNSFAETDTDMYVIEVPHETTAEGGK